MGRISIPSGVDFSPLTDGDECFDKSQFCSGLYLEDIAKDEVHLKNSEDDIFIKFKLDEDLNLAKIIFTDGDGSSEDFIIDIWNYKILFPGSNYKIGEHANSPYEVTATGKIGIYNSGSWKAYFDYEKMVIPPKSSNPGFPVNGMKYYNTSLNKFVRYENGIWIKEYSVKQNYTVGGVTINHPVGMFNNPPKVTVTLELLNLSYATNIGVSQLIENNTNLLTKIRASKHAMVFPAIQECLTNDVIVHVKFEGD